MVPLNQDWNSQNQNCQIQPNSISGHIKLLVGFSFQPISSCLAEDQVDSLYVTSIIHWELIEGKTWKKANILLWIWIYSKRIIDNNEGGGNQLNDLKPRWTFLYCTVFLSVNFGSCSRFNLLTKMLISLFVIFVFHSFNSKLFSPVLKVITL